MTIWHPRPGVQRYQIDFPCLLFLPISKQKPSLAPRQRDAYKSIIKFCNYCCLFAMVMNRKPGKYEALGTIIWHPRPGPKQTWRHFVWRRQCVDACPWPSRARGGDLHHQQVLNNHSLVIEAHRHDKNTAVQGAETRIWGHLKGCIF